MESNMSGFCSGIEVLAERSKARSVFIAVAISMRSMARSAGVMARAFRDLAQVTAEIAPIFWAMEWRRRIWFWRGFTCDRRYLLEYCLREEFQQKGWWWRAGRRAGELLGTIR